jgi:hypothetical protein
MLRRIQATLLPTQSSWRTWRLLASDSLLDSLVWAASLELWDYSCAVYNPWTSRDFFFGKSFGLRIVAVNSTGYISHCTYFLECFTDLDITTVACDS